jgi:hypothetical protein
MMGQNPAQILAHLRLSFVAYFCYESISNTSLIEKPSRLWDAITLSGSALLIHVIAMELVIMNNHEPPTHLVVRLLRCCATKTISSHSSMCICDQESRSPESSFSTILYRKRENKIFGKRSTRLLDHFSKLIITAHLPLRRSCMDHSHIFHEVRQSTHGL